MPKIFVLRHQLQEQQAKLRQHDKGGESSNSPSLSSDEESRPDVPGTPSTVASDISSTPKGSKKAKGATSEEMLSEVSSQMLHKMFMVTLIDS